MSEELAYITPGITKMHTEFVLPEVNLDSEQCGNVGIYFIQDRDGYIKIGQSAHLWRRVTAYKTHRAGVRLVGIIVTGAHLLDYNENLIHRLFEEFVVTGEWFAPVRILVNYLTMFNNGVGFPIELMECEPNTYEELVEYQKKIKAVYQNGRRAR